jgi:glycosyltransferase involved in cell wall biosynthesis
LGIHQDVCLKPKPAKSTTKPAMSRSTSAKRSSARDAPSVFIVIPAYNEETVIGDVIAEIRQAGYGNILVVDDGSRDATYEKVKETGVLTLRHRLNRGKGAATKTGIEAAKLEGADIIVTMDGDGQHSPADIEQLVAPIRDGHCDVVLGTRLKDPRGMPKYKDRP